MTTWYNQSWIYRKSHTVVHAASAGTNYQVKITVHYGSGADSVGDVYTSSHCKTDFGDIIFCDSSGNTLLSYWMESKTNSNNAVFWVKITDDITTSDSTIYIYYGNPAATTGSNGANTFIVFDDMSTGGDNWANLGGASHTRNAGSLSISGATEGSVYYNSSLSNGIAMRVKYVSATGNYWMQPILMCDGVHAQDGYLTNFYSGGNWTMFIGYSGNTYSWTGLGVTHAAVSAGTIIEISKEGNNIRASIDNTLLLTNTDAHGLTGDIGFRTTGNYNYVVTNVCVRKFVSPEPTNGAWGTEIYAFNIVGVTRDSTGAILGSCTTYLFRSSDLAYMGTMVSDVTTGAYSFNVTDNSTTYQVMAEKIIAGVKYMGVTDWVRVGA